MIPPRLYCVTATGAPVVAVFRRGPSSWAHVGLWNLREPAYQPGAWLRGRLFPRRSDLSPDGRLLCYFAHQPGASWSHGDTYVAVSRLPWLTTLHAFGTCGTWTRGYHFVPRGGAVGTPPDTAPPEMPFELRPTQAVQFATERRRGWDEAPDSPPRAHGDAWDERRNARVRKPHPSGTFWLHAESLGRAGGEFGNQQAIDGLRVHYWIETETELDPLDDVQWADWDADGRLLVATRAGTLEIRRPGVDGRWVPEWSHDLSSLVPEPVAGPAWASEW